MRIIIFTSAGILLRLASAMNANGDVDLDTPQSLGERLAASEATAQSGQGGQTLTVPFEFKGQKCDLDVPAGLEPADFAKGCITALDEKLEKHYYDFVAHLSDYREAGLTAIRDFASTNGMKTNDVVDSVAFAIWGQKWRTLPKEFKEGTIEAIAGFRYASWQKWQCWTGKTCDLTWLVAKMAKCFLGRSFEHWGTFLKIKFDSDNIEKLSEKYYVEETDGDYYAYVTYEIDRIGLRVKPCIKGKDPIEPICENVVLHFHNVGENSEYKTLRDLLVDTQDWQKRLVCCDILRCCGAEKKSEFCQDYVVDVFDRLGVTKRLEPSNQEAAEHFQSLGYLAVIPSIGGKEIKDLVDDSAGKKSMDEKLEEYSAVNELG